MLFLAQDPLGPLYPSVYAYAERLERECDAARVPLIGRAEPLSRTCKSRQLQLLRRAGLTRAARSATVALARRARPSTGSGSRSCSATTAATRARTRASRAPSTRARSCSRRGSPSATRGRRVEAWPGLAAVEYVEAQKTDGFFRKHKSFVFGDRVMPGIFSVVRDWFAHHTLEPERARYGTEVERYLHGEIDPHERELSLAAAARPASSSPPSTTRTCRAGAWSCSR